MWVNARSLPPDSLLSILCRELVPKHRWVMRMLVYIRNRLRSGLRGNLMSTMIHYSTNTDKETYGASEGGKGGKWAISDACQRDVGNRLTFKASRRLKVFPQPWHALFWDFAECRAWCRLCHLVRGKYDREVAESRHVLAVMLPSEALVTPWPLALVRTLFRVRPQVT